MKANAGPSAYSRSSRIRIAAVTASAVVSLAAFLAGGFLQPPAHALSQDGEKAAAAEQPGSLVTFVPVQRGKPETELILPASLGGLQEATLYARTSGYLKRWLVDLGDKVEAGQLVAEIETPELDQELQQAEANLQHAKVSLDLARATAQRYRSLRGQEAISEQDIDEKESAVNARAADLKATEAQIRRLRQLKSFAHVKAPFAGSIVSRNIEIGSLISAGSSSANGWLFKLVQANPIRAMVSVPQNHMGLVVAGQNVDILVRERAGKVYKGRVTRSAGALDPTTRTLLVEVRIPNESGELIPGMYAQARFNLQTVQPPIVVSGNTLIVGGEGPRVALLGAGDVIQIRKVRLGRDYGKEVEIVEGLQDGDRIVMNPRDTLETGMHVKAIPAPKAHDDGRKPAPKANEEGNKPAIAGAAAATTAAKSK